MIKEIEKEIDIMTAEELEGVLQSLQDIEKTAKDESIRRTARSLFLLLVRRKYQRFSTVADK